MQNYHDKFPPVHRIYSENLRKTKILNALFCNFHKL